jgi:hypothetical protein
MCDAHLGLQRELRGLRVYVALSTALIGFLSITAFRRSAEPTRFEEIDVQRINIREPDGKLRMILSNRARSTGPIAHGKPFGYPGGTRPGMIFFNDEETENGGLIFEGKAQNGGHASGAQLSFDQYDQDQVVYLTYDDENGKRTMGLNVADRGDVPITELAAAMDSINRMPDGPAKTAARQKLYGPRNGVPMFAPRVFVGRDPSRSAILRLSDPMGRPRLRMIVDSLGAARIEFLDGRGRVVQQIPAVADSIPR